jgi:hypothetical protein
VPFVRISFGTHGPYGVVPCGQVGVAARRHHRIALEKERGIPGAQLIDPAIQEDMPNFFAGPADFFDAFAPPTPLVPVADNPVDVALFPVGSTRKLRMNIPVESAKVQTEI